MVGFADKVIARAEDGALLFFFWALGAVVFAQFFSRYFLNMPLGWTEELARYLMISVAFLGLPVVTRLGEHIAIDLLAASLPAKVRSWVEAAAELIQLLIVSVLAWQAWRLAGLSVQSMSSLPLPKSVIYYVVLAGLGLHVLAIIHRLAARLRSEPRS
ncbi:TRAP transporter small permease [Oricola thermophila]|uniref:TRAP transporter small permease protein n=1 Tax=Oricola thermophila TaxID=2742145 RepID=A0A6N1VGX9_9HYPH|nr:TRAP transporter small permease [Oricola thermophila]QKV20038.1 TRAP transporter small permease [Oricola thermophila]